MVGANFETRVRWYRVGLTNLDKGAMVAMVSSELDWP